ncbi:pyruvate dehydrogenase E1 component subunit alpha type I, mitochondrial-like isoform X3 [Lycorma delicatula]|uniref:pyruvate dehydrogenase E1 component subunit alpha type I, mitochondrial-like isoform X3 n=1 Tax=Lycorma delicatula TaxID=130591 RepID=UPI003F51999B
MLSRTLFLKTNFISSTLNDKGGILQTLSALQNLMNNYATEVTFETKPFKLHKLESGPSTTVTVTKKDAMKYIKHLLLIRRLETAAGNLYKEKVIRGFCHLYSGQVPLGAGVAFAAKYLGSDGVCFSLYGDGASNQGQVFEAFNISKLWDIPCVFVCENNGYGMGTSAERSSASTNYYSRGDYIPGIWVDGMDVLAVREAAEFAIKHCAEKGPIILEMVTYRYSGHSMSDPGTSYRTRDEIQVVRQTRDPITSFKERLTGSELLTNEEIKEIETDVKKVIDEAIKQAKSDKEIGLDELTADICYNFLEKNIRNVLPWNHLTHKRVGKTLNEN